MFTFYEKYDQFSIYDRKKENIRKVTNVMTEWIDQLFCSKRNEVLVLRVLAKFPLGKSPARKLPPGIFKSISLIVFLYLILRS